MIVGIIYVSSEAALNYIFILILNATLIRRDCTM